MISKVNIYQLKHFIVQPSKIIEKSSTVIKKCNSLISFIAHNDPTQPQMLRHCYHGTNSMSKCCGQSLSYYQLPTQTQVRNPNWHQNMDICCTSMHYVTFKGKLKKVLGGDDELALAVLPWRRWQHTPKLHNSSSSKRFGLQRGLAFKERSNGPKIC